ncbi:response regulator [Pectobacterium brasiliense]|uniref:response regulator n=1 Tax=Pectobacterium brasiliense TaxID=180957 RepID=UPI000C1C114E|nr:response regulator [Pectobacterium brasiliense]ATV43813.1 transcriptional regulator [Pectobacterium brasiliense]MCA6983962.1 response regulator [Pectobacterium brasiliense]MCH4993506.1 response regulator [Pectobacterium brasiliense]
MIDFITSPLGVIVTPIFLTALLACIGFFIKRYFFKEKQESQSAEVKVSTVPVEVRMKKTSILFIDDEKFLVIDILKNSGWEKTTRINDVKALNQKEIIDADIIFVDIQGVGVKLGFRDEGLGLSQAIKEKYPEKKIIIYSAEKNGNRFHAALKVVDDFLEKDADPYRFELIVEKFS